MLNKNSDFLKAILVVITLAYNVHATYVVAQTIDVTSIETEKQRLNAVRTVISQEKFRRLQPFYEKNPALTAAQCEKLLEDLLSNKSFKPLEPVAVLNFEYPIWDENLPLAERRKNNQIAAKQLGSTLVRSLKLCNDDGRGDAIKFQSFTLAAGAPPFRLYAYPDKLNPFPKSKLVYWSEYAESVGTGRKGYSWVDLQRCEHESGTPVLTDSLKLTHDPLGQQSALTLYKNMTVAWDVARGFMFKAYVLKPNQPVNKPFGTSCSWVSYSEPSQK